MIFEICASLATIAFLVLVGYLICTLIKVQKSLKFVNQAVEEVLPQISTCKSELMILLKNSNDLTVSVRRHIDHFDPLLQSIANIGIALNHLTHDMQGCFNSVHVEKKMKWRGTLSSVLEVIDLGVHILQKLNKGGRND